MATESDGIFDSYTPDRPLSLLEKKQLKWSQEKADQTEWFPFGRPGAGAPLQLNKPQKARNDVGTSPNRDPLRTHDSLISNNQSNKINGDSSASNLTGYLINQPSTISSPSNTNTNNTPFLPQLNSYPSSFGSIYSTPYLTFVNYPSNVNNQNGISPEIGGVHMTPIYQNLPFLPPVTFATFQQPNGVAISTPNQVTSSFGQQWFQQQWQQQQRLQSTLDMKQQFVPPNQFPFVNSYPTMHMNEFVKNMQPNFSGSPIYQNQSNLSTAEAHSTAWISPQPQINANNGPVYGHQTKLTDSHLAQNMAVVSPFQNKNNDSTASEHQEFTAFNKSQEYEIHRRTNAITDPKDRQEQKEKINKANETKAAFDEQIAEKQRQKLMRLEEERLELERLERDRKFLEFREKQENEQELNKWRRLLKEEERRERSIKDAWEKAKEEAMKSKRNRLLQHAQKKETDFEKFDDDSELVNSPSVDGSRSNLAKDEQHSLPNLTHSLSANSFDKPEGIDNSPENNEKLNANHDVSVVSPRNVQALSGTSSFMESFIDDRPIRPLTKDPLKIWDSATKSNHSRIASIDSSSMVEPQRDIVPNKLYKSKSPPISDACDLGNVVGRRTDVERFNLDSLNDSKISRSAIVGDINVNRSYYDAAPKRNHLSSKKLLDVDLRRNSPYNSAIKPPEVIVNKSFASPVMRSTDNVEPKHTTSINYEIDQNFSSQRNPNLLNQSNVTKRKKDKLLSRPFVLNSQTLATSENEENPWGDKLGGENPLLLPLKTRSKRIEPLPSTKGKTANVNFDRISSPTKTDEDRLENFDSLRKSQDRIARLNLNLENPPSTTSENCDRQRFNFRNHKYSSSLSIKRQPSENKTSNEIFDQLTKLRELKHSQKTVEDNLPVPRLSSKRTIK